MTTEQLREKLDAEGVSEHYIDLICDPCEDAEDVLGMAVNVANDEGSYLKKLADMIEGWEKSDGG